MPYNYKNPSNRIRARRLLKASLPHARKIVESGTLTETTAASSLGANSLQYYSIEKCDGMHVYQGAKGGWFCDFAFVDLPPGIPDAIGTPVSFPEKSQADAVLRGVDMLAMIMANKPDPPSTEDAVAMFPIDDLVVHIPIRVLEEIKRAADGEKPEQDYVLTRLTEFRKTYTGDGPVTSELADAFPQEVLRELQVLCTMALLSGLVRDPPYLEAAPPKPGTH